MRAEQAGKTRQAVLETSRKLFLEHGFDATSLQQIADTTGVAKANVYYYFRTKIAILEALLEPTVAALAARLDEAERISDPGERAAYFVTHWVDQVVTAYRSLAPMSTADPIVRRHPGISRTLDRLAERSLHLLFGPHPTTGQQAAYWLMSDLGAVTRRLDTLPDDELRATLTRLCLGLTATEPC